MVGRKRNRLLSGFEGTSIVVLAIGAAGLAVAGVAAVLLPTGPALGHWAHRQSENPAAAEVSYRYESVATTLMRLRDEIADR